MSIINRSLVHKVSKHILEGALGELGVQDRLQSDAVLSVAEVEALLTKVYKHLFERSVVEEYTELALNWVLKCYDWYGGIQFQIVVLILLYSYPAVDGPAV